MGNFKKFLKESEITLEDIKSIIDELTDEEADALGVYLYTEFFEFTDGEDGIDDIYFTKEDVLDMVEELGEEMYDTIYDLISYEEEPEEDDLEEGVNTVMMVKNLNRKKRKFFAKSAAQLRIEKPKRKIQLRKTYAKRKAYMRANAAKIKQYRDSRKDYMKSGSHFAKLRKKSGMASDRASGAAK